MVKSCFRKGEKITSMKHRDIHVNMVLSSVPSGKEKIGKEEERTKKERRKKKEGRRVIVDRELECGEQRIMSGPRVLGREINN